MLIPFNFIDTKLMNSEWNADLEDETCITLYAPDVNKNFYYPGIYKKEFNMVLIGCNEKLDKAYYIDIEKIKYWSKTYLFTEKDMIENKIPDMDIGNINVI